MVITPFFALVFDSCGLADAWIANFSARCGIEKYTIPGYQHSQNNWFVPISESAKAHLTQEEAESLVKIVDIYLPVLPEVP